MASICIIGGIVQIISGNRRVNLSIDEYHCLQTCSPEVKHLTTRLCDSVVGWITILSIALSTVCTSVGGRDCPVLVCHEDKVLSFSIVGRRLDRMDRNDLPRMVSPSILNYGMILEPSCPRFADEKNLLRSVPHRSRPLMLWRHTWISQ